MRWFKTRLSLVFLWLLLAVSVAYAGPTGEITVSAALSLKGPFEDIGKVMEKRGVRVIFNFGASGMLQKQIEGGAPVDVFAAASLKEMDELLKKGLIKEKTKFNFAGNSIVLVSSLKSGLRVKSFSDLTMGEIKRIAIGNPATVPAGKYSEEVLRHFGVWDAIKNKLVFAENVKQVMDYVVREEVEAGMLFQTDALARKDDVKILIEAPQDSHKPVVYAIAAISGTKNEQAAKEFISLVMSEEGRGILQRYGFRLLKEMKHDRQR